MSAAAPVRDRSRYQGKNLALLLLAMALPAGLLYVRILLGDLVGYTRSLTAVQIGKLSLLSNSALAAFVVVQVLCAFYILRLVPPRRSQLARVFQYLAVLALCVVLSITGAVLIEAFGVNLLLRTGRYR